MYPLHNTLQHAMAEPIAATVHPKGLLDATHVHGFAKGADSMYTNTYIDVIRLQSTATTVYVWTAWPFFPPWIHRRHP